MRTPKFSTLLVLFPCSFWLRSHRLRPAAHSPSRVLVSTRVRAGWSCGSGGFRLAASL